MLETLQKLFIGKSSISYKRIYLDNQEQIDSFVNIECTYKEKIWMILNNILAVPLCKFCNTEKCKFIKFSQGYTVSCGKNECVKKHKNESTKKTCIEKYGTEHHTQNENIQNKKKVTNLEKYGFEHALYAESVKDKMKASWIKKYGVDNPAKSRIVQDSIMKTNIERYGVKNVFHSKEMRSRIAKNSKIPKPELKLIELFTNRGIQFEHQYTIENPEFKRARTFDFAIFKADKLVCLVEHDGQYYHGYISDQDDKKVYTDYDITRLSFVPENVKLIVILEQDFENGIKELFSALDIDYEQYVNDIFTWCREIGFPYSKYNEEILKNSYIALCKRTEFSLKAYTGNKLLRHFHKSIYHAKTGNYISPYDAWLNDEILIKAIKNRIIYKNKIDPSRVLDAFSIAKIAPKVSVFQPLTAKYLINKYLTKHEEIFDPFSGFSGRMLGASSLGKRYIGYDINKEHILESKQIVEFLNLENIELECVNSLEKTGTFECLFTCPPYEAKEIWNENEIIKSCDEWIDECIKNYQCNQYLFVIDKTEKYKDFIVEELINKSHFAKNTELVIFIKK